MILIISESTDQSTFQVCSELTNLKEDYLLILESDVLEIQKLQIDSKRKQIDFEFRLNGQSYSLEDIDAYWYRRSQINIQTNFDLNCLEGLDFDKLPSSVKENLNGEYNSLAYFLSLLIQSKPGLGNIIRPDPDKMEVLALATSLGLSVPDTLVTSDKDEALAFFYKYQGNIVTKPIHSMLFYDESNGDKHLSLTKRVEEKMIKEGFDHFFPSKFQQQIEKDFEIRIFYLLGEMYSMAIFSQGDAQTQTDFRHYNQANPNRTTIYDLPHEIKKLLDNLMHVLHYKTGSIDMIVTPKGEHIFLEVNPVGQFGMVSYPCNFNLNKKIAQGLLSLAKN